MEDDLRLAGTDVEDTKLKQLGFTIVELMLPAVVVAILAAIAFRAYQGYAVHAKVTGGSGALGRAIAVTWTASMTADGTLQWTCNSAWPSLPYVPQVCLN